MEQRKPVVWIRQGLRILFLLGFVVFFVYSFQSIFYIGRIFEPRRYNAFFRIVRALTNPNLESEFIFVVIAKMWETIQMGFLATTISAILAIPVTFLGARPSSWWGKGLNIILQPVLAAVRAVHPLIVSIIVVALIGLGPSAGVLAITISSAAFLIKIFTESAQQHPAFNWMTLLKKYFPALAFKHLPVNILIATVIGFVGGGGIGFVLQQSINLLNYRNTSTILVSCIFVIGSLDLISQAVWRKIQASV